MDCEENEAHDKSGEDVGRDDELHDDQFGFV